MDVASVLAVLAPAAEMVTKVTGAVAGAVTAFVKVKELAGRTDDHELKKAILEFDKKLYEAEKEALELRRANDKLAEEIKRLSGPPELTKKNGLYYHGEDGPVCEVCYKRDGEIYDLQKAASHEKRMMGFDWRCNVCRGQFSEK